VGTASGRTEAEHLVGAVDRLRTTFRWKADDLDAAGPQTRVGASSLTLGGLLAGMRARLREARHTNTTVLDSRVTVFNEGGVAIEVIWS
jgi:hypothetical protein